MKIAIITSSFNNKGGVSIAVKSLGEALKKNNHEVHYFTLENELNKYSNIFKDVHLIISQKKEEQLKFLKNEINKYNFDFFIANTLRTHYLLSKLKVVNDIYIFHHGSVLNKKNFFIQLKKRKKFQNIYFKKKLVFLNQCFKNEFDKLYNVKYEKSYIIPNMFDFNLIIEKANEINLEKNNYILGIGRLSKEKNFEYLIKAYAKANLKEELWILGDGKERKKIEYLVNKLKIKDKVKFLGWKKNPYPYMKYSKLNILPSKYEAFGNVIVESLILNTPVISTDIKCGPRDILKHEEFLVPLNKIDIFAKKIKYLINNIEFYKSNLNKLVNIEFYSKSYVIQQWQKVFNENL